MSRVRSGALRAFPLIVLACLGALVSSAAAAPSRDINEYVLFADESLNFKGGSGDRALIDGGHVGVNKDDPDPSATELTLGNGATDVTPDSSQIVAQKVRIANNTTRVCNIYANETSAGFDPVVMRPGCSLQSWGPLPIIAFLPALPTPFNPGTGDTEVASGTTVSLAPGSYGTVHVRDQSKLVLTSGTYELRDLLVGKGATVETNPDTIVKITGQMRVNNGSEIEDANDVIGSDLTRWFFNSADVTSNAHTVSFGRRITFHGTVYAPNGKIALGHATNLFGRFWAKAMNSDSNVKVTYRAPETVSGQKFLDLNGDGAQDAGEGGLAGFTFYIDVNNSGQFDAGEPSAQSDASGNWSIGPLYLAGTYTVREVQQSGYTCTYPGSCSYQVNLGASGQDHPENVFGNKPDTPPCVPAPGQDANCQPVVTCVPQPGQDANCQPITESQRSSATNSARLRGPSGCVRSSSVQVSGHNIKKVRFTVKGRKKIKRTDRKSPFRIRIRERQLKRGANRVIARIIFRDGKRKTERLTVQRCASRAISPKFTG